MIDWPPGWPRTSADKRTRASFGVTKTHPQHGYSYKGELSFHQALQRLQEQVRLMRGTDLRIDTGHDDTQMRQDGLPRSGSRRPDDPGIVVRFRLPGSKPVEFACDRYTRYEDNLAAVAATVRAKRDISRYGCATADREFAGYQALPSGDAAADAQAARSIVTPPPIVDEDPSDVLGVTHDAPPSVIRAAWKAHVLKAHPDRGGSEAAVHRLTKARDQLLHRHQQEATP